MSAITVTADLEIGEVLIQVSQSLRYNPLIASLTPEQAKALEFALYDARRALEGREDDRLLDKLFGNPLRQLDAIMDESGFGAGVSINEITDRR